MRAIFKKISNKAEQLFSRIISKRPPEHAETQRKEGMHRC